MHGSAYIYIFIAVMALTTYFCRVLAFTLVRKPIRNRYVRSFLYYVPYVTLAVMTFPAIVEATRYPVAGMVSLIAGILCAWFGGSLFLVAGSCCLSVFVMEMLLEMLL